MCWRRESVPGWSGTARYEGEPSTDTIYLRYLSDRDSMIRGLETGVVSYYFDDLSNGEIPRISSASANIPLPNLVFLGFNSEREAVSDPAVRGPSMRPSAARR